MDIRDSYLTIAGPGEGMYKEKGSKFFSFAFPVRSEDEIKDSLGILKKKYYDARHHCYAYILGPGGEKYRANDDGEPGHSAGDPILGQIKSNNLTNTLIVVVRYFGGTKLGVSGLINAYKTSAAMAIAQCKIVEKLILSQFTIRFEYPLFSRVMKLVKDRELQIIEQKMEMSCEMVLAVRLGNLDKTKSEIRDIHGVDLTKK